MKGVKPHGLTDAEAREQAPTDYGKGRVCQRDDCNTHLSRYNPLPYCYQHEDEWYDEPCEEDGEGNRKCKMCGRFYTPGTLHWVLDNRMRDGYSAVCRYCRRYPERVKKRMELREEDPELRKQRALTKKRARDRRYRDRKRARKLAAS